MSKPRRRALGLLGPDGSGGLSWQEADALREQANALSARFDSLQREVGRFRQEREEMKTLLSSLGGQLEHVVRPLKAANDALVAAAEIVEAQRLREIEHRDALHQVLASQRAARLQLSTACLQEQHRLTEQLAALDLADRRILEALEARATAFEAALEQWQSSVRQTGENLREKIERAAQDDQDATDRLIREGEGIRAVQAEASRQLLGLNRTLQEINQTTREVVATEEARVAQSCHDEAVRLNRLGLQHLARGSAAAAARFFAEASIQAPAALEPRFNQAVALLQAGHAAEAARQVEELVAAFPGHPEIVSLRGVARLALGDLERARTDLAGPASAESGAELCAAAGLAHLLAGDARAALRALDQAARHPSPDGVALREAGFGAAGKGD